MQLVLAFLAFFLLDLLVLLFHAVMWLITRMVRLMIRPLRHPVQELIERNRKFEESKE